MTVKRKIVLRISGEIEKEKIIEEIMSRISAQEAFYRLKGDVLELRLIGDPISVERSVEAVRKFASSTMLGAGGKRGGTIVQLSQASKTLGVPVPIEAFSHLLEALGVKVKKQKDEIIIYERAEKVREIARDFFLRLRESRTIAFGKAAELIAILSFLHDLLPIEISEIGKELGVLEEKDGKAQLRVRWDDAFLTLNRELSESKGKEGESGKALF
ncbi:MAG: DUF2067 family protein [Fervidicoccaceae archaeon]